MSNFELIPGGSALEAMVERAEKAEAELAVLRKWLEAAEKKAHDWEEICRHLKAEKPDQHRPARDKGKDADPGPEAIGE